MNYLIDTHLILWSAGRVRQVPAEAMRLMSDPEATLWFSVVSIWEVAIKRGLDRPDFRTDPAVLRAGLLRSAYRELPVEGRHCFGLMALPRLHNDPFDRMLFAQAQSEGMVLLTSDKRVAAYGDPALLV